MIVPPVGPIDGFTHLHAAHCESGVTAALLRNVDLHFSEPMIFGIGSGLFFAHFSFFKVMGHPLTTFRSFPGSIFKKASKRLGVTVRRETFRRQHLAMDRLDQLLDEGKQVGLQVNIYWLPYIPKAMRVHFNGHNLIVIGKQNGRYLVSDPVMESLYECPVESLRRARFSGGPKLLARGLLYYPDHRQSVVPLHQAIQRGLTQTCRHMLHIPGAFPWLGVQGIRHLGRRIPVWPQAGEEQAKEWLAGLVRMQEEIGTGGAGFRFLYAAFLQEASNTLGWSSLATCSNELTEIGDHWRRVALHASRIARKKESCGIDELGRWVLAIADEEEVLFQTIEKICRGERALLSVGSKPIHRNP